MQRPIYRYQALPGDGGSHIRVATIHPAARFLDDVYVSLRVEEFPAVNDSSPDGRLDKIPSYEAMSYYWGPQEGDGYIFVRNEAAQPSSLEGRAGDDGEGGWLPTRANLLSALRHLRHETEPRDMWIDAICIDQDDVVQKGPQVALMGTLYSRQPPCLCGSARPLMEAIGPWSCSKTGARSGITASGPATSQQVVSPLSTGTRLLIAAAPTRWPSTASSAATGSSVSGSGRRSGLLPPTWHACSAALPLCHGRSFATRGEHYTISTRLTRTRNSRPSWKAAWTSSTGCCHRRRSSG